MLMLSPPRYQLLEHSNIFEVMIGGAEANVAIGLKRLGISSGWISKLVDNPLGRKISNTIRGYGVDVSKVVWTEEGRIGLFFVEFGAEPRSIKTIYDRCNSAMSTLKPNEIDMSYLEQVKVLHQTGITPALSVNCRDTTIKLSKKAREMGVTNSFDINYRSMLWSHDNMRTTLDKILPNVGILISTLKEAHILLEDDPPAKQAANELRKKYGNKVVVITLGGKGGIAKDDRLHRVDPYLLNEVNRLGAGDSFCAGFIYGYLNDGTKLGLNYGCAMAALKHTIPQNFPLVNKKDVDNLIKGKTDHTFR